MGDANHLKRFVPKEPGDTDWAEGMRYLFDDAGEGVLDAACAVDCFKRGAALGNRNCMIQLASCYESGRGVPQDYAKAREWRGRALGVAKYKLTQRPPKGLAEITKAVDKLEVVVEETIDNAAFKTPYNISTRKECAK